VNAAAPNGLTPLMMAAGYGQVEIVATLLTHRASISRKDSKGRTAADYARTGVTDVDQWTYGRPQAAVLRLLEAAN
jgi:hypothetical protein